MKKYIPTMHSKMRYSERVGYRNTMDDTVRLARKYGVRLEDIPNTKKNESIRSFMKEDKIYYKDKIYIFAGSGQYKTLITIYCCKNKVLERIFLKKEKIRKEKYYQQLFTSQNSQLYTIVFYKGRVAEFIKVDRKEYYYEILHDETLMKNVPKHLGKLLRGTTSDLDVGLYFGDFTGLEEQIYKQILAIPLGETITYKELAVKFDISVQMVTGIINRCPIPVFIPTHRVIKSNGQIGSYVFTKDFKKNLLLLEKTNSMKTKTKKTINKIKENENKEYFSYDIGHILSSFLNEQNPNDVNN